MLRLRQRKHIPNAGSFTVSLNPNHDNQNFGPLYDLIWECIEANELNSVTVLGTLELVKHRIFKILSEKEADEDDLS